MPASTPPYTPQSTPFLVGVILAVYVVTVSELKHLIQCPPLSKKKKRNTEMQAVERVSADRNMTLTFRCPLKAPELSVQNP